jgi:hypothetical protein
MSFNQRLLGMKKIIQEFPVKGNHSSSMPAGKKAVPSRSALSRMAQIY